MSTEADHAPSAPERGLTSRIVHAFLVSRLSLLLLLASLLAGAVALLVTPREEEPQIVVPFADVLVRFPGATAEQVENLVAAPLERLLWGVDGVEYVYSASRPGEAVVTVRFYVGEDRERSLVKLWNKVMSHPDVFPPGVAGWTIRPVEIDDVPIVLFTLWSGDPERTSDDLRRVAEELVDKLARVPETGSISVTGGEGRRLLVYLDPVRLSASGIAPLDVERALLARNFHRTAGGVEREGLEALIEAGSVVASADDLRSSVIGVYGGRPVYLGDVARIEDGPAEPETYVRIGFGPAAAEGRVIAGSPAAAPGEERPAVTVAVAKRKGSNAVTVAEAVIRAMEDLRGEVIPDDVSVVVTRDYGETANHKVNELVKHLLVAVATIIVLLALALGPREALIVAVAVPMTLAVTLLVDLIFGYTINRVTLFALILSLGLLVDDPIVDVENIYRHFKLRREPPLEATLTAVDEVRPPTILATFTVIVSFLPLFFITGMMGPYMAPMALNVPVAMLVSLLVAFTVTPWATYHLLKGEYGKEEAPVDLARSAVYRVYRALVGPLLARRSRALLFLGAVFLAFLGSVALAVTRAVPMKMLPFDNKNEMQVVIDMPRGRTLEETDRVARAVGRYLATVAEVTDYEAYVGTGSPMDFNGMVRHYYLRDGPQYGDIRVNLVPGAAREQQSHEVALRIRPEIERIGREHGATLSIVEPPPGPPVLATLVGEVYGPLDATYADLRRVAERVRADFAATGGVVDVNDYLEEGQTLLDFRIDPEKAALTGVAVADVVETLSIAVGGASAGAAVVPEERTPLQITLLVPRDVRTSATSLLALRVRTARGDLVPIGEVGRFEERVVEHPIYHKNLRRVAIVMGEMAGRSPVEAVFDLQERWRAAPLPAGFSVDLAGEGEWKITVDVFRDLGIAFAAALAMIYVLLVGQTGSLLVPLIIMVAIPLTLIGIMPGFWLLNHLAAGPVGAFANPIFFTATGMIGMIALAGIVVRNSIILVDFIETIRATRPGVSLEDAIIEAGAVRLRPIFLTAGAAMFGSFVITLDPIFSGLAWSFIFGIFASTGFTLVVVPVVYHRLFTGR